MSQSAKRPTFFLTHPVHFILIAKNTCIHTYICSSTSQASTSNFVGSFRENVGRDFILTQDQNKIVNDGSLKAIYEIESGR